jgi:hypothetical protein
MPIIKNGQKEITLTETEGVIISKGEAPKSFLTDGENLYVVKKPKKRTFGAIFKNNFPSGLVSYEQWTIEEFRAKKKALPIDDQEQLAPFAVHLNDLLFEAAFGEVLYQQIAKTLFSSFESTESFLHIDAKTSEPSIISKFRFDFNEFMEKKLRFVLGETRGKASDWNIEKLPCRDALGFNDNENHLMGKLYAVALLTNDWDLVNNIMLSNAGCVGDSHTATQIMVVDGGNKFHFGFDGLTCDETAFENPAFNPDSTKNHPLLGYDYTLPFDKEVLLQLPRLLIPNLFELDNHQLFQGFKEATDEAVKALCLNPFCINQAINSVEQRITLDSHKPTLEGFRDKNSTALSHNYYYSKNSIHSLETLIKGRCRSLKVMCHLLESDAPVEEINRLRFEQYHQAQNPKPEQKISVRANTFYMHLRNEESPLMHVSLPQILA